MSRCVQTFDIKASSDEFGIFNRNGIITFDTTFLWTSKTNVICQKRPSSPSLLTSHLLTPSFPSKVIKWVDSYPLVMHQNEGWRINLYLTFHPHNCSRSGGVKRARVSLSLGAQTTCAGVIITLSWWCDKQGGECPKHRNNNHPNQKQKFIHPVWTSGKQRPV